METTNASNVLYTSQDSQRRLSPYVPTQPHRSEYWRDYARVVHCPSYRRLCHKTQLFPGAENGFFRNRLTHSIEVAEIARSITRKINRDCGLEIDEDIVALAANAHDIGHAPFGHVGEKALDRLMREAGGFEGNAQTLRILSRLEKKRTQDEPFVNGRDNRVGLNLTYRSLASILKYDNEIPIMGERTEPEKGYYATEADVVEQMKEHVLGIEGGAGVGFKTIECSIMDLADDIAYSTYDLEDAFKSGLLSPIHLVSQHQGFYEKVAENVSKKLDLPDSVRSGYYRRVAEVLRSAFRSILEVPSGSPNPATIAEVPTDDPYWGAVIVASSLSAHLGSDGHFRTLFTSELVANMISEVTWTAHDQIALSSVSVSIDARERMEIVKHAVYVSLVLHPRFKVLEHRANTIIGHLFEELSLKEGELLPDDFKQLYHMAVDGLLKKRIVCDFIAGMTDRFALEYFHRLSGGEERSIFRPHG
jgi:dGTPase